MGARARVHARDEPSPAATAQKSAAHGPAPRKFSGSRDSGACLMTLRQLHDTSAIHRLHRTRPHRAPIARAHIC